MDNTTFGTTKSPLGSLPAELRNNIYAYVLVSSSPVIVSCEVASTTNAPRRYNYIPGLLATCKQAHTEATEMFISRNTFELQIKPRQTTEIFQLFQHEARHLWAFLDSLRQARLPIPKNLVVRISRTCSHIPSGQAWCVTGREVMHQLIEIRKFAAHHQIRGVVCVVESSWGVNTRSTRLDLDNIHASAGRSVEEIELQHPSGYFPKSGEGMATFWHWKTLLYVHMATQSWANAEVKKPGEESIEEIGAGAEGEDRSLECRS